jgi:hypothetical protein
MSRIARKSSKRQAQNRRSSLPTILIIGGVVIIVVVIAVLVIQSGTQPAAATALMGTPVPILSRDHIPSYSDPGQYNSNPPAGGHHFDTPLPAKFYQETDLTTLPPHPEGYLVHSLEHGYVIFWYNCAVPGTNCTALKQSIQNVMNAVGSTKLIAFPWKDLTVSLAMSSWGQVMNFPQVDEKVMQQFVLTNRYQAPEPDAQ